MAKVVATTSTRKNVYHTFMRVNFWIMRIQGWCSMTHCVMESVTYMVHTVEKSVSRPTIETLEK